MLTAGLLARAAADGHRTVLVVATEGEAGLADSTLLHGTTSLGELRRTELEDSARVLGVSRVEWLGFTDSGSDLGATLPEGSLARAPVATAAQRLADILIDENADVLTSYDRNGGYGHPDHMAVHAIGRTAARLAGTATLLEATFDRDLFGLGIDLARQNGFEVPPEITDIDMSRIYAAATEITHRVDVSSFLDAKRASMQAHVSQTTGATGEFTTRTLSLFLSLPDELFALAFGTEYFIEPGTAPDAHAGFEDLFGTQT